MKTYYLTESRLGDYLERIFPEGRWIHNKIIRNSGSLTRPDYRATNLQLIVEFDGYMHYSTPKKIITERNKQELYESLDYRVVRIPYFVQMSTDIIKVLFDTHLTIEQEYPHGFIDSAAMLPAGFCELGIAKFEKDLEKFSIIREDIINSLKHKVEEYGDVDLVLPPSLRHLLA